MASPAQFSRNIRNLARLVETNVAKETRKAALIVHQTVTLSTPVDTGRARSNWQVELGAPAAGTLKAHSAGKGGSTAGENTQATLAAGAAKIDQRRNQDIHITNNLPYIERLNEGWSAQAPAGFVEKAVAAGVAAIRRARVVRR